MDHNTGTGAFSLGCGERFWTTRRCVSS
jgi:hypothetical protein